MLRCACHQVKFAWFASVVTRPSARSATWITATLNWAKLAASAIWAFAQQCVGQRCRLVTTRMGVVKAVSPLVCLGQRAPGVARRAAIRLSLIHISEPTRLGMI